MFASILLQSRVSHLQKLKTPKQHVFAISRPVLRFLKGIFSMWAKQRIWWRRRCEPRGILCVVSGLVTLHSIKKKSSQPCVRKEDTMLNTLRNSLLS